MGKEWIPPAEKPFKCDEPGCNKTFLNKNGWLYHTRVWKGKCGQQDDSDYPYRCYDAEMCGKKYRAIAGLRYHYKSSGEHGAIGYQMLLDGDHPEIDKSIRWPPLKQEAKEEVKDDNDEDDEDELDDEDRNYQPAYQQQQQQQQTYYQPLQAQTHQLHNISPTPPSSTFMTPSTSSEGVQQQQRLSNRPLRAAVVQAQARKPTVAQEGFFTASPNVEDVRSMIVPPNGEVQGLKHAPLPSDLLEAVNAASHTSSNGPQQQQGKNRSPNKVGSTRQTAAAVPPPPLTFGARNQRFNPYANSSAKGYYYASPAPPKAPRVRRQSF